MADPTTTTATGAGAFFSGGLAVLLGPIIGPWVAVMLASFVGALWTVGKVETESRSNAALLLLRIVLTALVLTGGLAMLLVSYTTVPLDHLLPSVAFAIGALSDKFGVLKEAVVRRFTNAIGGKEQ